MKSSREIRIEKQEQNWNKWKESEDGQDTQIYTNVINAYNGLEHTPLRGYYIFYSGSGVCSLAPEC